jgi:mannosyltransferase
MMDITIRVEVRMFTPADRLVRIPGGLPFASGVAGTVVVAAVATSFQLGHSSFVYREAASDTYARLNLHDLLDALRFNDVFFGVYYALLHGWMRLFGESEAALRSFSVVCAVAAVVAIACLARNLAGPKAGIAAAAFAAVSPLLFDLGHEARPYAMLVLLATLASSAFLAAALRPSAARWLVYALIAIFGCYIHLFTLTVVIAHVCWATLRRRALWSRGLPFALLGIGLAVVPLLVVMHNYGVVNAYIPLPRLTDLVSLSFWFAGSRLLAALAAVAVLALFVLRRAGRNAGNDTIAFLLLWLLIPPCLIFAASFLGKPIYTQRYMVEAWPAYVIALAIVIVRLPRPAMMVAAAAVVLASVTTTIREGTASSQEWRGASAFVLHEAGSADAVVIYPKRGTLPFNYYRRRLDASGPRRLYPLRDWFPLVQGKDGVEAATLDVPSARPERVWVLEGWTDVPGTDANARQFLATLKGEYRLSKRWSFEHVAVLRFDRSPRR